MSLTQKERGNRTEVSISPENVRLPGGTAYDKEALARFRKENYITGQNGNWDFASSNTLRNSVNQPINMDGMFDRFKVDLKGGYFSHTHWNKSTFDKKVSFHDFIDLTNFI